MESQSSVRYQVGLIKYILRSKTEMISKETITEEQQINKSLNELLNTERNYLCIQRENNSVLSFARSKSVNREHYRLVRSNRQKVDPNKFIFKRHSKVSQNQDKVSEIDISKSVHSKSISDLKSNVSIRMLAKIKNTTKSSKDIKIPSIEELIRRNPKIAYKDILRLKYFVKKLVSTQSEINGCNKLII